MSVRFFNKIKNYMRVKQTIKQNKRLCQMYPFLIPWNRLSGYTIIECAKGKKGYWPGDPEKIPSYNYEYTELDNMPTGWRKAFGLQMCQEIKDALVEDNDLDRYRVVQCKEKYGSLRWYNNGTKVGSMVRDIERKYEGISAHTCIICGKPATKITLGWISPFCDDCCPNERAVSVNEYFNVEEYE